MLKLPYAIRDFYALITEGYLYIDRTDRISVMENLGKELLFLRPRHFANEDYYDHQDEIERIPSENTEAYSRAFLREKLDEAGCHRITG